MIFTIAFLSAGVIIAYIIAIIYLINTADNGATIILDLPHMLQNTRDKLSDGYGTLIKQLEVRNWYSLNRLLLLQLLINNSTDTDAMVLTYIEDRILSTNKWQFSVIIALASIASFTSPLWTVFVVKYPRYVFLVITQLLHCLDVETEHLE